MGESQAWTDAGNTNVVNIGEDQGLTLESRDLMPSHQCFQ